MQVKEIFNSCLPQDHHVFSVLYYRIRLILSEDVFRATKMKSGAIGGIKNEKVLNSCELNGFFSTTLSGHMEKDHVLKIRTIFPVLLVKKSRGASKTLHTDFFF